jgi:hypothetical protein
MQYNEILARRLVAEVARSSIDGGALQPVMLHEVARRLKIDEASAESAMFRAVGSVGFSSKPFTLPDPADGGRPRFVGVTVVTTTDLGPSTALRIFPVSPCPEGHAV